MSFNPTVSIPDPMASIGATAAQRLILLPESWPAADMALWTAALAGHGPEEDDNPAANWSLSEVAPEAWTGTGRS